MSKINKKDVEISNLKFKLHCAEIVMMAIDDYVHKNLLDSRSKIADARNNFGNPFEYKYLRKDWVKEE